MEYIAQKATMDGDGVFVWNDGHFEVIISKRKNKYFNLFNAGDGFGACGILESFNFTSTTNTMHLTILGESMKDAYKLIYGTRAHKAFSGSCITCKAHVLVLGR